MAEWTSVCNSTGRSVILYKRHFYNDDDDATYDPIKICDIQVLGTFDRGKETSQIKNIPALVLTCEPKVNAPKS